jgi:hypothetical protein
MSISAWSIRNILDSNLKFTTPGLNVYLRTKNSVEDSQQYVEYGLQLSASGGTSGFTDTLITPPPSVTPVSLHNIGLNQAKLMFGARQFDISHTWVLAQMAALGYSDSFQVFRDPSVIGLVYDTRLYSMDSIYAEAVNNEIIRWIVMGNKIETELTTGI